MSTRSLERAFVDRRSELQPTLFDGRDGPPGTASSYGPSIASDRKGRVYVVTTNGLVRFDPQYEYVNRVAPPVAITDIAADGVRIAPALKIRLPLGTSRLVVRYAGLSFTDPTKVRFRYMLDGLDKGWRAVGSSRQATYTLLPPGSYTFHVIAANNSGVWSPAGASLEIVVPAPFQESWWFKMLCLLVLLALAWFTHRWRLAMVSRQLQHRMGDRLGERERIARELHDTLLQSVQGLILRLQASAQRLTPTDPTRSGLLQSIQQANTVLAEGRDRVLGLRSSIVEGDLTSEIAELVRSRRLEVGPQIDVEVVGRRRPVAVIALEDLMGIIGEALFNALRHARASHVTISLAYQRKSLTVAVSDDGCGMRASSDATRGTGVGLLGMRERAQRIGGRLAFESSEAGTTVQIVVPGRVAFTRSVTRD